MGFRFILFLLSAVSAGLSPVWAASPDVGVSEVVCETSVFAELKIRNYPAFKPLACDQIQNTLESATHKIRVLFGIPFRSPKVFILNDEYAEGGSFHWRTNVLSLRVTEKEDPSKYRVTFTHEMGHGYFAFRILDKNPEALNLPDVTDFRRIQAGYDELFADVVAALLYADPDVMSVALTTETMSFAFLSFSQFTPLTPKLARDSHGQFAPLRKDLWEQWIVPRQKDAPALLRELSDILIQDIFDNYKQDILLELQPRLTEELSRLREKLKLSFHLPKKLPPDLLTESSTFLQN